MEEQLLFNQDSILKQVVAPMEVPSFVSTNQVFHDVISCIIEQQIHYRSSKKIFANALIRSGIAYVTPENFHLLELHGISNLKMAMNKYETLLRFVEYWSNQSKDFFALTDEEVIKELSSIKGIGQWTIDMVLLYTLKRPNIFPVDDFHLKQVMIYLYQLDPKNKLKSQMLQIAEKWGNQKSLAVLYLLEWKKLYKLRAKS
jgi:DNA-3-methyladenine glycosylase II